MAGLVDRLGAFTEETYTDGSRNTSKLMKRRRSTYARKCLKRASLLALSRNLNLLTLIYSRCTWTGMTSLTICLEGGRILSGVPWKFLPT